MAIQMRFGDVVMTSKMMDIRKTMVRQLVVVAKQNITIDGCVLFVPFAVRV